MIFKKIFLLHIYSQILENMQLLPVGIDKYCEMWYTMKVRRRDGIGRRARLKISCPRGRAGSTPAAGTIVIAGSYTEPAIFSFSSSSSSPRTLAMVSAEEILDE